MLATTPHTTTRVLLAEDDEGVRDMLTLALELEGLEVETAEDGVEVVIRFDEQSHDVVVTDLMMPKSTGVAVVRAIRRQTPNVPVLIVTANDDPAMRIVALEAGADDIITKPFEPRELAMRIQNLVHGRVVEEGDAEVAAEATEEVVTAGLLELRPEAREATFDGKPLDLTVRELDLLLTLAKVPTKVFSRAELLQKVWDSNPDWQSIETVTEHVYRVRQKLAAHPGGERLIQTVRGAGYRLSA